MEHILIHGDFIRGLQGEWQTDTCFTDMSRSVPSSYNCIFADPPDNIGCKYAEYVDKKTSKVYVHWLRNLLERSIEHTETLWLSHNSRWAFEAGKIVCEMQQKRGWLEAKQCVQTFTFGQHNHHDLGNNHRPLLRLRSHDAPLYPDAIRVPSWRQKNGDKRADPRGRVPGDVFDFPRVTGNSKQRRKWHPTQLHGGLVERCIKLCTEEGDSVFDPFAGTGTTMRVCRRIGRQCTTTEIDRSYCEEIAKDQGMKEVENGRWVCHD